MCSSINPVRRYDYLADVPVLFVTANPEAARQAALDGQHACLAKPFGLDEFIACVQGLLRPATAVLADSA